MRTGRKAVATYDGKAREVNRTDGGRVRREKDIHGTEVLLFDPGDEKAQVTATRGFKSWFSARDAGLTVESTITVSVKCNQDEASINVASTQAGKVAETQAQLGMEEMGLYLDAFKKDTL